MSSQMVSDSQAEIFMRAALKEAERGIGLTSPNPAVGAVLVIGNKIVARGHHAKAGGAHAEVECLRAFGRAVPKTAVLYVTLEPCSSAGRTSPCTAALIEAGVRRVVIGATDPNPRHSGRGIEILRAANVEVRAGILDDECRRLNEAFNKWITTGRSFVIAKCGMSLDGRLTRPPGEESWITSPAARRHARALRAQVDAVLVGAETVRKDNPRLTIRDRKTGRQPWRVVLTRSGLLPRTANVFTDRFAGRTLVLRNQPLQSVLENLGAKAILSVLIEGGGEILGQALDAQLIDKVQIYLGAFFTGGPVLAFGGRGAGSSAEGARLKEVSYRRIGNDVCVTGYPIFASRES